MFKILSCNPSGLFSYGLHQTIYLDNQGSVLLEGVNLDRNGNSNGSGKTSLFYSLTHILYGKNPSGEGADKVVNEFLGKYFGQIVFLDKDDKKWRVTDVRKWRKADKYPDQKFDGYVEEPSEIHNSGLRLSGTDVYLEAWDEKNELWTDERSSNREVGDVRLDLKATRKKIVDILGIDYDQFMSVAYLAQQQTLTFISGAHKDRLQVLAELSDLKAWDQRVTSIREDIATNDSEKSRLESKLEGLGQVAFNKPDPQDKQLIQSSIDTLYLQTRACDHDLDQINLRQELWGEKRSLIASGIKEGVKLVKEADALILQTKNKLDAMAGVYARDCENIRSAPRPAAIAKHETEISELNGQIIARRFDLEQLMVGSGKCSKCRTNVSMDHILRHRELINLEITALNESVQSNRDKLGLIIGEWEVDVRERLDARSMENTNAVGPILQMLGEFEVKLELNQLFLEDYKQAEINLGQPPNLEIYGIEQKRLAILARKSAKEFELKNWEESLKRYDDYQTVVSATKTNLASTEWELKHLRVLERLFGDKGIKAFKLDNILSILNQSLEKYIDIITDSSVKVWVSQYREKTDGELVTDLQIIVREGHKHEVPFALYSGGERQQITLAFIGAFWQLASRCGAGVNIMCLDEVFANLDVINSHLVFNFLNTLRAGGKSSMFVVTHDIHVKDQVNFDQIWTVIKQNGVSRIDQKVHTKY